MGGLELEGSGALRPLIYRKSPRAALYEGIIWGFYSVNGRVADSRQHFYRVRRSLYLIEMTKFPHLIVWEWGKLQCMIKQMG